MHTADTYNDKVVLQFSVMTVVWGIVGMLVGLFIAAQLYWPALNFDLPWLSYGRLRPLHTNAVIFAFGGSALMATSLYVVQRTSHVRLLSDKLAAFVFWGWQLVILLAAITLPLGLTQGKEYAELIWPIDVLIAVVWVAYGVLFFGTIVKRRVKHIYVANCTSSTAWRSRWACCTRSRSTAARSMRWCSGGTATTRWVSS
jgi:cytochrome c oxidase cbb3-type subunit 1